MSSADTDLPPFPFKKVAVIGPGLIGGSILLKLASLPEEQRPELSVWARRIAAITEVRDELLLREFSTAINEAISGADLIIFATPVTSMVELAPQVRLSSNLNPRALITDVGSVKGSIATTLRSVFVDENGLSNYLSSHPMAGSEKKGFSAAKANLFEGRPCLISKARKDSENLQEKFSKLSLFWNWLGCKPIAGVHDKKHDDIVAAISHLPHLAAAVATTNILSQDPNHADFTRHAEFTGGGFRDFTRIAAGDSEMWTGIMMENKDALADSLESYITDLNVQLTNLREGKEEAIRSALSEAQKLRQKLDDA